MRSKHFQPSIENEFDRRPLAAFNSVMSKVFLGIDPGSRVTGYGLIQWSADGSVSHLQHGVFDLVSQDSQWAQRLAELNTQMTRLLQQYQPDAVIIENIFLGKNAQSAFKLGQARGVLIAQSVLHGCEIYEYATRSVKKGITGSGAAEKIQVQGVLQLLLKLPKIHPLDASDALAMAVYHGMQLQTQRLRQRLVETVKEKMS